MNNESILHIHNEIALNCKNEIHKKVDGAGNIHSEWDNWDPERKRSHFLSDMNAEENIILLPNNKTVIHEKLHTCNIMQTEHVIFRDAYVHLYTYIHVKTIN